MPYVRPEEPWHPYAYMSKKGRWRLSPKYWYTPWGYPGGYKFYMEQMDPIMESYRPKPKAYRNPNTGKIFYKTRKFDINRPEVPIYYNYSDWLRKAKKYALIRRRIYLNKQKALAKRRAMRK